MPDNNLEQSETRNAASKAARNAAQRKRLHNGGAAPCPPDVSAVALIVSEPVVTAGNANTRELLQTAILPSEELSPQDQSAPQWNGPQGDEFALDDVQRHNTREVAAAILEGQPLEQIARLITDIVAQRLCVERVGLFLRDERGLAVPIALRNVSAEYGRAITRLIPLSPISSRAMVTGLPIFARDVQNDPQTPPELRELYCRENVTGLLLVMLQYEQRLAGTLVVYPDADREFSPADIAVFQSLADMATLGIALSQQVQQQREFAMLEERNRLAREIHDTVAQSLAALILQIDALQFTMEQGEAEKAGQMLTVARTLARSALEDTRRAVRGLAAAGAQNLTPAQAIAQEAQQLEAESGIATQFVLTGDPQSLTSDQRASLLRITQEALTNARKHARPQRVRVGLQYGAEAVTLLIEDDGLGFDASARRVPGPEGGYGLFGIGERAALVGGTLQIDSTPGWGTRIRVTLPYRASSDITEEEKRRRGEEERGTGAGVSFVAPGSATAAPAFLLAPVPISGPAPPSAPTPDTPPAPPTRVLVVDDYPLTRQGIRAVLQRAPDIEVVGEAADGGQAVEQALLLRPDVVLMDWQMPGVDGLEGLRRLRASLPQTPVLILTMSRTEQAVGDALANGARGFLLKDADPDELLAAVRAARRGESLLSPAIVDRLASLASGQGKAIRDASELNEREREVLQLLAQGARNKEIATALFIAPKTVEYHLSNIFAKLDVTNRTEAARIAVERGLVAPGFRSLK